MAILASVLVSLIVRWLAAAVLALLVSMNAAVTLQQSLTLLVLVTAGGAAGATFGAMLGHHGDSHRHEGSRYVRRPRITAVTRPSTAGLSVRISGHPLAKAPAAAKARLGYPCAPEQLPGLLTGRQCLEVYAIAKGLEAIDPEVLALAEALRFTPFLDGFVDTYSLGTRQRLCVLLALLGEPDLLVFDEAFNGLDPRSALALKQALHERLSARRCGVVLATHSLDIVEHHADAAALLLDGVIAQRWSAEEIERLRASGADALEAALASAAPA